MSQPIGPQPQLPADRVCADELVLWRTRPPLSTPDETHSLVDLVMCGGAVISVTSNPGVLWSVLKTTGEVMWSRSFEHIGGVVVGGGQVVVQAGFQVVCADAETGATRWETPRQTGNGPPPFTGLGSFAGRVFWIASNGTVICVEAGTGREVMRSHPIDGIPGPLLALDGKLIGSHQARAFAIDAANGRVLWTRELGGDAPRRLPVAGLGGVLIRLEDGIVQVSPDDGAITARWSWPGQMTGDFVADDRMAFAVRCGRQEGVVAGRRAMLPVGCRIVRLGEEGSVDWELRSNEHRPILAWDREGHALFEAGGDIGLVNPSTGARTCLISVPGAKFHLPPLIETDRIYASVTIGGELFALRRP